jgi:hypothetical protein
VKYSVVGQISYEMSMSNPIHHRRPVASQAGLTSLAVTLARRVGRPLMMTAAIFIVSALLLGSLYYLLFALISHRKWV